MSCSVGHRCSLDSLLLWLWLRPAAVALIQPLARELPYVTGEALKTTTTTKKETPPQKKNKHTHIHKNKNTK